MRDDVPAPAPRRAAPAARAGCTDGSDRMATSQADSGQRTTADGLDASHDTPEFTGRRHRTTSDGTRHRANSGRTSKINFSSSLRELESSRSRSTHDHGATDETEDG